MFDINFKRFPITDEEQEILKVDLLEQQNGADASTETPLTRRNAEAESIQFSSGIEWQTSAT